MKSTGRMVISCVCFFLNAPLFVQAEDFNIQLTKATLKLENEKSTTTVFFLTRPAPAEPSKVQFILITAAHVLESMSGDHASLVLRREESDGVYKKVPTRIMIRKDGKALWTKHPTEDVACMLVTPPKEVSIPKIPLDYLADDDQLKRIEIHPGDTVKCLGYPHRVEANAAGFPILRNGSVASFPLTPTKFNKSVLVSMNTFEGDSGGPVYLSEASRMVGEKRQLGEVRLILGMVVGQHLLDEEAKLVYGTMKLRHRLGLAIVTPASFIKETIDSTPSTPK